MKKGSSRLWFPEPTEEDNTYANRGEPTPEWLARSTIPRARECRRFLNEHIAYLPQDSRDKMAHDLRHRYESAFFELVLIRIFQELGAHIEVEPSTPDGKYPDLRAEFPDGSVIVEATVPVVNAHIGETEKRRIPLLDYIETISPEGWWNWVLRLPDIGPNDSQKEFKRKVREALDIPPLSSEMTVEKYPSRWRTVWHNSACRLPAVLAELPLNHLAVDLITPKSAFPMP